MCGWGNFSSRNFKYDNTDRTRALILLFRLTGIGIFLIRCLRSVWFLLLGKHWRINVIETNVDGCKVSTIFRSFPVLQHVIFISLFALGQNVAPEEKRGEGKEGNTNFRGECRSWGRGEEEAIWRGVARNLRNPKAISETHSKCF